MVDPGAVYPAGVVVCEIERAGKRRRFLVHRTCGHVVPMALANMRRRAVRCRACALAAIAGRARERAATRREVTRAAYVRHRMRSYESGPGGLLTELTLHVAEPEPSSIRSDAWGLVGTVRAALRGEAA